MGIPSSPASFRKKWCRFLYTVFRDLCTFYLIMKHPEVAAYMGFS
jgi:hypothetical protein